MNFNEELNSINDFVSYVKTCKEAMRQALIGQEQDIPVEATLDTYAGYIAAIEGGGGVTVYTVQYLDWDGAVLKSQQVLPGGDVIPPTSPARDEWVFTGWSGTSSNVQSDLTATAQYEYAPNIVVFTDYQGKIISTQNIPTGLDAIPPIVDWGNVILDSWSDYTNIQGIRTVTPAFHTRDSKTYITLKLDESTGLTPILVYQMTSGDRIDIDWGDGNASQAWITGQSVHTYLAYGTYTLSLASKDGTVVVGYQAMPKSSYRTAFEGAYLASVISVVLGATVTDSVIAFRGCVNLDCVALSNTKYTTLKKADSEVYKNCTSLDSVMLPSDITSLNGSVFNGCSSLKTVIIPSTSVVALDSATYFTGAHPDLRIYVPEELVNNYKAASNWSSIANKIYQLNDLAVYGN